ncbi:MAG: hypothetical protein OXI84_11180 [bacterium]|nr:hypothetical protein [bacterium]
MKGSRQPYKVGMLVAATAALITAAVAATLLQEEHDTGVVHMAASGVVYQSLEELATIADLIVVGTVTGVAARADDYRTTDPDLLAAYERAGVPPYPIVFYEIAVGETLKGQAGESVYVGRIDPERAIVLDVTPLRPRQKVLLFLRGRETPPGLHFTGAGLPVGQPSYMLLGMDNGVFDVSNTGSVTPRMPARFTAGTVPSDLYGVRTRLQAGGNTPA